MHIGMIILIAVLLYSAGFALAVAGKKNLPFLFFIAGWTVNLAIFAVNWIYAGEPPFGNMYHVLVFLGLCFMPAYFILRRVHSLKTGPAYFMVASVIPLIGAIFMGNDLHWQRVPALQSNWFVPHVTAYMISYALAAIAFLVMAVRRLRMIFIKEISADNAEDSWRILRLAFPFMTFGMLSGALWADDAWGTYWSWDPKETWSLITWMLYLAFLHCQISSRLRKFADIPHLFAFMALLTTFILVNILPKLASAFHSYA